MIPRIPVSEHGTFLTRSWIADGLAPDEWHVIADDACGPDPDAHLILQSLASARPDVDIWYGDETIGDPAGAGGVERVLKAAFDVTRMTAEDHVGWPLFLRGRTALRLGRSLPGDGVLHTFDLLLHAHAHGAVIEPTLRAMSTRTRRPPGVSVSARRNGLMRWAAEHAPGHTVQPGRAEHLLRFERRFEDHPLVTIVVAGARESGAPETSLRDLLDDIAASSWPAARMEVIGDDPGLPQVRPDGAAWPFDVRRVRGGEGVPPGTSLNTLWQQAAGTFVVFLSLRTSLRIEDPGWLASMISFAQDPAVGGVAGRTRSADGRIAHAGIVGRIGWGCGNPFPGPRSGGPAHGAASAEMHRQWTLVSGAAFALRREVLAEANGFDLRFPQRLYGSDLCLRLGLLGYRIVYTPHASFIVGARPADERAVSGAEVLHFVERWRARLASDPYLHPDQAADLEARGFPHAPLDNVALL